MIVRQPMARIVLDDASLVFRVRQHGRLTLKELLVRQLFHRSVNPLIEVRALQHLSLGLNEGQRIGIVGNNGAGKSSLLKLIAGVYRPTSGKCLTNGRISSLFDISLGFDLDATGWENIDYRGYLQGETPKTIAAKRRPIAEFSELGEHLDMPVRYYSTGMLVRLAFSIATAAEPEILLVDEVLSAGDITFQEKARARMRDLINKARLVLMVSHDLTALAGFCHQVVWLDRGQLRALGPAREVISAYSEFAHGNRGAAA